MKAPNNIDHIVYTVSDLETGIDVVESLLGARPVVGGRHPAFGTHNALLSLGAKTYLEIIAPDPGLPAPCRGLPFGIVVGHPARVATWALRTESIVDQTQTAVAADIDLGAIQPGTRETSDGRLLTWQLTDPNAMPLDGAIPFLISWGKSAHPANSAPRGGELAGLRIEHPDALRVRQALSTLGVDVEVNKADKCTLIARIKTAGGIVELK